MRFHTHRDHSTVSKRPRFVRIRNGQRHSILLTSSFLRFTLHCKVQSGMNDLNRALGDISSIRRQMARSTEFRGYGPATLAATGLIAFLAAAVQALFVPDPVNHISSYL